MSYGVRIDDLDHTLASGVWKEVPCDRLRKIRSVLTVVGGEIVHDTGTVH